MAKKTSKQRQRARKTPAGRTRGQIPAVPGACPVVGIGASAGGIEAFTQLLRALQADTGMAYVFILHTNPSHHSLLPEILSRATAMPVKEVTSRTRVLPNHVYVAPAGSEVTLKAGELVSRKRQDERVPPGLIDRFLRSLAEDQGHQAIGVVLSGSASDGTIGLEEIKAVSGVTFAQDGTALHESMPRSAVASGCVDFVMPPDQIARELTRISGHPYLAAPPAEAPGVLPEFKFHQVLETMKDACGVDFSHYKRSTLQRRISRRLLLSRLEDIDEYAELLRQKPEEAEALFQDLLISVTGFFRNPESIEALKTVVFPALTNDRSRHDTLRLWALGCSTGQEAYTLAIALAEFMEESGRRWPVQIFATDLNGASIDKARTGLYPHSVVQDISQARLRRYFVEEEGGYRVRKSLRDVCIFARHNILGEPPFSRIDLVSCRNMLIYLEPGVQQRIIPILHYALRPEGYLWLGGSETVGVHRELFELVEPRHKIYRKKPVQAPVVMKALAATLRPEKAPAPGAQSGKPAPSSPLHPADSHKEAERILLSRFAPASVLVDHSCEILQFRGNTGLFLAPAPGRASLNLLKMLREGLLVAVRAALGEARKKEMPVRREGLRLASNGGSREVSVEVIPVGGGRESQYLVVFQEARPAHPAAARGARGAEPAALQEHDDLRQELAATREYLQAVIEQQEAANEELQSANEEIQSANEELQSINEELETSKEEIQSSNEELSTVNEELNQRNLELTQSNNDLVNLLASVQAAIIMLGHDLRIRRFTPTAEKLLNLIASDIGRPIQDLNLNISLPELDEHLEEVIDTMAPKEFEVRDKHGHWQLLRLRPYRTMDHKIDGVVVMMIDIDSMKRTQEALRRQARLLDHAYEPILAWEPGGNFTYCNQAAEELYGYSKDEMLGRRHEDILENPRLAREIEAALVKEGRWTGPLVHKGRHGNRITVDSRMIVMQESEERRLVIETNRPLPAGAGSK